MFRREIRVSLAKRNKAEKDAPTQTPTEPIDIVLTAHQIGTDAVKGAAILIATYVAADTLRKVTLEIVKSQL